MDTAAPLQKDLAKALGVSPAQVTRLKARGMPVDRGVDACRAWREAKLRPRVAAPSPVSTGRADDAPRHASPQAGGGAGVCAWDGAAGAAGVADADRVIGHGDAGVPGGPGVPGGTRAMTGIDFDPPPDYQLERARREAAEARIAEFRLAELSGDLIRADQVRSARAKAVAAASAALQQLPARLAPIVAAESDLARCHDAIERELHDLMRQIAVEVLDGGA